MVVYPLIFTIYIALTNYSDGHLLSKEQVVSQFTGQYFQDETAPTYSWTAYRNAGGQFQLVFEDNEGNRFLGTADGKLQPFAGEGDLPAEIDGYQKLETTQTLQYLGPISRLVFSDEQRLVRSTGLGKGAEQSRLYVYDPAADSLTNNQTDVVYTPVQGTFTAPDGSTLAPGFNVVVGLENYQRVLTDRNIRGPFIGVFIWTFVFAALTVLLTFTVGLGMAMVLNDKDLPLKGIFRSIIIIPYSIPAVISTLIWVGLLNPNYGQFTLMLASLGVPSDWMQWFSNGTAAKVGILLVNTWLGYPYMMLLCLGALQSIPTDMYEAADIDGVTPFRKFWNLTLPLLLVSVAPLLIGSFAFNFNNFGLIEAYNRGGPPIAGASTPAGQTDILISYTFRLAFGGGQGADYGLASAIALFIFVLVAAITAFNFRYTKQLEELT